MKVRVPYIDLAAQHRPLKKRILQAVSNVIDTGHFILGGEVNAFEQRFAEICGTRFALGVADGTSALVLVLRALGIGPGDEVITAPNSFLASASSIALAGATPVFADVGDDMNIDPEALPRAITPRTRAILPVHLTGRPARMDALMKIAAEYSLFVIEDCAQAVGAKYCGQAVGSIGHAGCFSLHPLKTLNAIGDGGLITTNDSELYERLRIARNHGLKNRDECVFWSENSRLDTLQAAILLVKLDVLDEWINARRKHAALYRQHLRNYVEVPDEKRDEFAVYHTFVIQADRRSELVSHLSSVGIETKIHYPILIPWQEAAKHLGYRRGDFPRAEEQSKRILSLPIYPELSIDDLYEVINAIQAFYKG